MTIVLNFNPKRKFKPLIHGSRIDILIYYQRPWESMMWTALKIKLFIHFVRHRCTFDFKLLFGFWRFSLSLPNYWQLPVEIEIRQKKTNLFKISDMISFLFRFVICRNRFVTCLRRNCVDTKVNPHVYGRFRLIYFFLPLSWDSWRCH